MKKLKTTAIIAFLSITGILKTETQAQIAPGYEVSTWYKFRTAAVSYTFDDNTSNQIPVALPLFDKYNFKATFFIVPGWGPKWADFKNASDNGHEVTSHTVSHPDLSTLSGVNLENELKNSKKHH